MINIILVVLKLWVGIIGKSQALVADGIHSLSDLFSDLIVIFGIRWGRKEPDENHPFGHGRIETIAGMVVGVLLILAGGGIVYQAFIDIAEGYKESPAFSVLIIALLSVILKEIMYWWTVSVGRKIQSLVVVANAWHHRSDAFSSIAVLIGAGLAYYNPKFHIADGIASIIVSVFIIKVGISFIWSALKEVVDTAPDKEILRKMTVQAEAINGVRQAHDIRARYSGAQIFVEIHIVVDPNLSVREGHDIAKNVESRLLEDVEGVTKVIVHVDPDLKVAD